MGWPLEEQGVPHHLAHPDGAKAADPGQGRPSGHSWGLGGGYLLPPLVIIHRDPNHDLALVAVLLRESEKNGRPVWEP